MIVRAAYHAVEIHTGNDGLRERGGGWGWGRGRAIVVILTTHNGRLLHLQTTGVQAKKGNGKWRRMKMRAKKKKNQVCETVQLLIPEVVCGYQRLIAGLIFIHLNYKHHQFLVLLLL